MRWIYGIRLFLKLLFVCALAVFLTLYPGTVVLEWFGYKIDMPVSVLLGLFFGFTAVCIFFHHIWRKIWGIPLRYFQFLQKRRQNKGERLLLESLTAIAAQQPEEAQSSIELAKVLLPNHPLTVFIAAQSAHMLKDSLKAASYFEKMVENPSLAFLGLRGLILLAKSQGDWIKVDHFLKQAMSMRPDSPWVQQEILESQIQLARAGQDKAISTETVYRLLPKQEWQKHQSVLLWLKAEKNRDDLVVFRKLCQKSHDLNPEFVVVAVNLAQSWIQTGHRSKAQRILEVTYKLNPHRELAYLWLTMADGLEPIEKYRYLEKLTSLSSSHPETWWVMAEVAFEAKLWGQARSYLNTILAYGESQSACRLMAQVEEAEYPLAEEKIRDWWVRASMAPKQEGWFCRSCLNSSETWQSVCAHCDDVGQIAWRTFGCSSHHPSLLTKQLK
jgi:HemY protein